MATMIECGEGRRGVAGSRPNAERLSAVARLVGIRSICSNGSFTKREDFCRTALPSPYGASSRCRGDHVSAGGGAPHRALGPDYKAFERVGLFIELQGGPHRPAADLGGLLRCNRRGGVEGDRVEIYGLAVNLQLFSPLQRSRSNYARNAPNIYQSDENRLF